MAIGIYQIKNIKNNLIYIGSSKDIKKRWSHHKYELTKNKHTNIFLQEDWNEFGESCFEFSILEECEENERYNIEQEYIDELLPFHRNGVGYNINENSKRKNEDGIRIFKNRYRKVNPFYKCSKKAVEEIMMYMVEDGQLCIHGSLDYFVDNANTTDKYVWEDVGDDIYMVKPTFGKVRAISRDVVDSMKREELNDYCDGMDTYYDLLDMAREGYMDSDDWF